VQKSLGSIVAVLFVALTAFLGGLGVLGSGRSGVLAYLQSPLPTVTLPPPPEPEPTNTPLPTWTPYPTRLPTWTPEPTPGTPTPKPTYQPCTPTGAPTPTSTSMSPQASPGVVAMMPTSIPAGLPVAGGVSCFVPVLSIVLILAGLVLFGGGRVIHRSEK